MKWIVDFFFSFSLFFSSIHFIAHITREFNRQLRQYKHGWWGNVGLHVSRVIHQNRDVQSHSFLSFKSKHSNGALVPYLGLFCCHFQHPTRARRQNILTQRKKRWKRRPGKTLSEVSFRDSALHQNLIIQHSVDTEKRRPNRRCFSSFIANFAVKWTYTGARAQTHTWHLQYVQYCSTPISNHTAIDRIIQQVHHLYHLSGRLNSLWLTKWPIELDQNHKKLVSVLQSNQPAKSWHRDHHTLIKWNWILVNAFNLVFAIR